MLTWKDKSFFLLIAVFAVVLQSYGAQAKARYKYRDEGKVRSPYRRISRKQQRPKSEKPNIIVILTDDQDELLGSVKTMSKTMRILRDNGAHCVNSFVTTPMCCPSRSTFLTGMYAHNHNIYTNNQNCSSREWQATHEQHNFATYLNDDGYRTGYFGKYLNEYNGTYIPPGWREWVGLVRNSRYYNYTINFNGNKVKHADNYYEDYLTDLIANDSVTFLKQSKQYYPNRPVLMVLSVPAPHGPEDAAPQYQHMFYDNSEHRTPSWNRAPNDDKQWLLQITEKMQPIHQKFTDMLQQKRLQTLQSVDDLLEKIHRELKSLGELDNSYILFTSDHGYHLGQFGLVKGKAMPYDFDVRVPLYVRGPGIHPGTKVHSLVANVDLAPTILDMAGIDIPDHMDGQSFLKLLSGKPDLSRIPPDKLEKRKRMWRDTVLLERGKVTQKKVKEIMRAEKQRIFSNLDDLDMENSNLQSILSPREFKLVKLCRDGVYQTPCKPEQKFECRTEESGRLRLFKCRNETETKKLAVQSDRACICAEKIIQQLEKTKPLPDLKPKLIRDKRFSFARIHRPTVQPLTRTEHVPLGLEGYDKKCRVLPNNTIQCSRELYKNREAWKDHKDTLDGMIQFYKQKLENLKGIRKHLKRKRPFKEVMTLPSFNETIPSFKLDLDDTAELEMCECVIDKSANEPVDLSDFGDVTVKDFDDTLSTTDNWLDHDVNRRRTKQYKQKYRQKFKTKRLKKKMKKKGRNCNEPDMKCFTHDNNHWKTAPYWTGKRQALLDKITCNKEGYECHVMENTHWKTPPTWTPMKFVQYLELYTCTGQTAFMIDGPFCFCPNSNNNTYWCLRTINETHNFLYCEFITKFISFYDMQKDPHQLRNAVHDLNYGVLQQLHDTLDRLRVCSGPKQCNSRHYGNRHGNGIHNRRRDRNNLGR